MVIFTIAATVFAVDAFFTAAVFFVIILMGTKNLFTQIQTAVNVCRRESRKDSCRYISIDGQNCTACPSCYSFRFSYRQCLCFELSVNHQMTAGSYLHFSRYRDPVFPLIVTGKFYISLKCGVMKMCPLKNTQSLHFSAIRLNASTDSDGILKCYRILVSVIKHHPGNP